MNKQQLIEHLNLEAHPEGGFFKETYRSQVFIDNLQDFNGPRNCSTSIYFLLTEDSKSHLHRIKSDEVWHFYEGNPLRIVMLSPEGDYSEKILGKNLEQGQEYQFVVPAGYWFGSEVIEGGSYSLVGCTVAPGFDFNDFEMADKQQMIKDFPKHSDFLKRFCINK